jgi:hypothetical protein
MRGRHHFWQGQPGHWKRLLVADAALAIACRHAAVLGGFDYVCHPDPGLTPGQADNYWIDLNRDELTEKLWHYTAARYELEQTRTRLERLQMAAAQAAAGRCSLEQLAAELARSRQLAYTGRAAKTSWKNKWLKVRCWVASRLRLSRC